MSDLMADMSRILSDKYRKKLQEAAKPLIMLGLRSNKNSMQGKPWKWGAWVEARAHYVGLKSKRTLQRALDISDRHLDRLLKSDTPPNMHQRTREVLAKALQVDPFSLEFEYYQFEPEAFPLTAPPPDVLAIAVDETSSEKPRGGDSNLRREIEGIVATLSGPSLQELHAQAIKSLETWMKLVGLRDSDSCAGAKSNTRARAAAAKRGGKKPRG